MRNKIPGKDIPYTTWDLFEKIRLRLIDTGDLPENLLEYASPTRSRVDICDIEFDVKMKLEHGRSEGIYLYMYLEGSINQTELKTASHHLGTFKTLVETKDAMLQMAKLGGAFIYEAQEFVQENQRDFIWRGYNVDFYEDGVKRNVSYWVYTPESAKKKADEYVEKGSNRHVIITNCADRTTQTIRKEE